ncbi:MAG: DNA-3-methyladenine glycosylase family protein, partial [Candidatus Thorarchaeota archaeon]
MAINEWITLNFNPKGPLDLMKTIESGHSSFPIPPKDKLGRYYLVINAPGTNKPLIVRLFQKGQKLEAGISNPNGALSEDDIKIMKKYIPEICGLKYDLLQFYEEFKKDPIASSFKEREGIRLTKAHDLFESLICSIMTQNNSVWKFNSQIRRIKELMGEKYPTEHFMIYSFPDPKTLFRNKHLLKEAKLGYREDYVIDTTEDIANFEVRLDKMHNLPTLEAKKQLLNLKGIGPKVADMFLLYGLGRMDAPPTDIWIQ